MLLLIRSELAFRLAIAVLRFAGDRLARIGVALAAANEFGDAGLGAVLLARGRMTSWLRRPRVWAGVVLANTTAMSLYLWHFTALVVVSAMLLPSGRFPQPATGSGAWWALRPAWMALLALVLVPVVIVFSKVERWPVGPAPSLSAAPSVLAALLLAAAMVTFTTGGLVVEGAPFGLPVHGLALLGASLALVRARYEGSSGTPST